MSASSREKTLKSLEADLEQARQARGEAAEEIKEVEKQRTEIANNGATKKKLDELRQRLQDARKRRDAADEAIEDLQPDVAALRTALDAAHRRQSEIDRLERQVEAYEAQQQACELLAQVRELLKPHRGVAGGLLPTLAEIARKIDDSGRMNSDWVPREIERTLEESKRQLAELKKEASS